MGSRLLPRSFTRKLASSSTSSAIRLPQEIPLPTGPQDQGLAKLDWPILSKMAIQEITKTRRLKRHALPCVLMRAGTSKGMFLHKKDLPPKESDWAPHLISALGSRGNDPRQIDGIGGGTSTTSKVAVVSLSTRPDSDIEWTFVQVAVGQESVDFTGTCGNITSGVAPFAVQEGLVRPRPGQTKMDVRIYNTNTNRTVVETVQLDSEGEYEEDGNYIIPGVSTAGSEVKCAFVDPFGSMTGKLFPSGEQSQILHISSVDLLPEVPPFDVRVTLIDSANPFVLIDATSISTVLKTLPSEIAQDALVEIIRREGAAAMGLSDTAENAAKTRGTPKIALLYPPVFSQKGEDTPDIRAQAYSMGLPHPSLQLTGAVCLAVALSCPGTVAARLAKKAVIDDDAPPTPEHSPSPSEDEAKPDFMSLRKVVIAHSKGSVHVDVALNGDGSVASCAVGRTARRLFEGKVRYYVQEDITSTS